jgi:hypothetical protein
VRTVDRVSVNEEECSLHILLELRQNYLQGGLLACSSPSMSTDRLSAQPDLVFILVKHATNDPSFRNANLVMCSACDRSEVSCTLIARERPDKTTMKTW